MEIYVHPTCSSCKKAEALLAANGFVVARRDYFKDRFDKAELRAVLDKAGLTPDQILSKRSRVCRDLELESKNLEDDTLLDLMIEHPTLLKRPLIIGSGGSSVGFNAGRIIDLVAKEA